MDLWGSLYKILTKLTAGEPDNNLMGEYFGIRKPAVWDLKKYLMGTYFGITPIILKNQRMLQKPAVLLDTCCD